MANTNASHKPSRTSPPSLQPIVLLSSTASHTYTHLQPVLLLSIFYLHFKPLVDRPVPTMIRLLLPTAIIQLLYLALCLPPSHSGTSSTRPKATSGFSRTRVDSDFS